MKFAGRPTNMIAGSVVIALWLTLAPTAFAHAQLVKAEPARRATVADAPKQLKLWFNEAIEGDYATLTVTNNNNKAVTGAKPEIADDDPKCLVLALPSLLPGTYSVKYRVLSVDGHVVTDTYDFSVK